jgi:hypothetical protein
MKAAFERPPGLLHNSGYAPRASIVWRGFGRGPLADETERIEVARNCGTWLHLCISIGQQDARYHRDWNSAGALLQLVEPGHGLDEAVASRRLVEVIEEYTRRLDWPRCLLTGSRGSGGNERVTLDHAPTAFVALAKSAGNLWLRDRPARLAPLQSPTLVEPGGVPMRGVEWHQHLWFPDGVPENLLAQALEQVRRRDSNRTNHRS